MFFMMGIMPGQKEIDFSQMVICSSCGAYGRLSVFMTYTVLSLFFIPILKWDKHFYVRTSCCNAIYELDYEVEKKIARGEDVEIKPEDMRIVQNGNTRFTCKICSNCGYETEEDFEFCPKCGNKL